LFKSRYTNVRIIIIIITSRSGATRNFNDFPENQLPKFYPIGMAPRHTASAATGCHPLNGVTQGGLERLDVQRIRQSYACGRRSHVLAVAGACGEVVRKRVADSRTDSGSDTASACGRGSVVRIHGLMRTQYFGIRTPLELETDCDQQHAQYRSAQPRPYLSSLIAPSLRLRPGHPAQPSWHRCIAATDNVNLKHMAN